MPLVPLRQLPGGFARTRRPASPVVSEEEERSLMREIGGGFMSGIGMAGNLLDVPASMVRDIATGQNPFDQLATPLRPENRARGREVLTDWFGMRPNRETGLKGWVDDPGEGLRDVLGFGAEVALDPLSWLTFGGASLTRGAGQAAKRAGLLPVVDRLRKGGIQEGLVSENIKRLRSGGGFLGPRRARQESNLRDVVRAAPDSTAAMADLQNAAQAMGRNLPELMDEPLANHFGLAVPFMDPFMTFNAGPVGRGVSRAFDVAGNAISKSLPVRFAKGLLSPSAGSQFDRVGQEIAELKHQADQTGKATARGEALDATDEFNRLIGEFDSAYGRTATGVADGYHPGDLDDAIDNIVLPRELENWERGAADIRARRVEQRPLHEFLRDNPRWRRIAREGRDYDEITNYDVIFEDWFGANRMDDYFQETGGGRYPGLFNDINHLWDTLQHPPQYPRIGRRPTRGDEGISRAAREHLRENPPQAPFRSGEVVRANDRGNYGYVIQPGARESTVFFRSPDGITATRRLDNAQLARAFDDPAEAAQHAERAGEVFHRNLVGKLLRATTEFNGDAARAFRELTPGLEPRPEVLESFQRTAQTLSAQRDKIYESILDKGGNGRYLNTAVDDADDLTQIGYFPRPMPRKLAEDIQKGRALPSKFTSMKGRTIETANLPSHIRDRILMENRYRGENGAEHILEDFEEYLNPRWGQQADNAEFDPDSFDFPDEGLDDAAVTTGRAAHAQAIADWAHGKPRASMIGDELDDHARYLEKGAVVDNTLSAIHEVMYRYAKTDLDGGVALPQALRKAGLKESEALQSFSRQFGMTVEQARNLKVPQEFVDGATSVLEYFGKGPEWQGKISQTLDRFNAWFKKWVTVPWPGFISRNFISGQHLNLATAVKSAPDAVNYGKQMFEANRLLSRVKGGFKAGGVESLDQADRQIIKELYQYRVIDPQYGSEGVEFMGRPAPTAHPLEAILPDNPLDVKASLGRARDFAKTNPIELDMFNTYPRDVTGASTAPALDNVPVAGRVRNALNTWAESGSAINKQAEWYNRVPLYLYFKSKGYSPAQAAKEVIARQFDYGDVSDFSRKFMKKVFPFWTFSSKIAPLVGKELLERPGGGIGQTIRASSLGSGGQEEPLPQYVRETTSIPLGELEDGTQRYLTGLGLAHEDPLSFISNTPVRGALLEAVSRSNPLLKGPLEWASGESFFQRGPQGGRDLVDMDPTVGRLLTNVGLREEDPVSGRAKPFIADGVEHALANSPLARSISTARTLTDDRKWQNPTVFPGDAMFLNLLTGLRATDISPAAQDAVVRDALNSAILGRLGGRSYENVYLPQATIDATEARGDMELAELQRKANAMRKAIQDRAKRRKKSA